MKFLLPFLLISSLLLSACSLGNKEDIFENKIECQKLKNEITAQMYQKYGDKNIAIEEIFYSPQKNSCLYTTINPTRIDSTFDVKSLNDFLTQETLISCTNKECADLFESKLNKFK